MIEQMLPARATAPPRAHHEHASAYVRPRLPRGRSPLMRRIARLFRRTPAARGKGECC